MQQEGCFKQTSHVDQLAIHFSLDGNMIHKDSDEARRQKAKYGAAEGEKILTVLGDLWDLDRLFKSTTFIG